MIITRNGADYGVFINTGIYYDASDAGALASEAVLIIYNLLNFFIHFLQ